MPAVPPPLSVVILHNGCALISCLTPKSCSSLGRTYYLHGLRGHHLPAELCCVQTGKWGSQRFPVPGKEGLPLSASKLQQLLFMHQFFQSPVRDTVILHNAGSVLWDLLSVSHFSQIDSQDSLSWVKVLIVWSFLPKE